MLKPDIYITLESLQWHNKEFVVLPPITVSRRFVRHLFSSFYCPLYASFLLMIRGPTLSPVSSLCFVWEPSHSGNWKKKEKTSEVHPEPELRTWVVQSSLRHVLIKSTATTDHNCCAGVSGLPEFWLNSSFVRVSAEGMRGLLRKSSNSAPLWCSCLRPAWGTCSPSQPSTVTCLEHLTLNLAPCSVFLGNSQT